ncbi:D-alanyl-D-alanine carboxypeptidase family protein [Salibacterium qingdaonense]|uniref:serine-type D-Ala-D-Ala carboxypeptidase n=1 Tax=Salibacterium qingdaonense TaxID=266892 RepID=A0A1I4M894_9BACI|nr:D-alanyl-D-alanine carboxypeptidase family protein [Salibacterium qingdaonense]SFL99481.1 D-Ala-D-Ala carboxypeptidase DacF. Serine peptidase. MEROPS family S11 [Salibacterium qingdaonense]
MRKKRRFKFVVIAAAASVILLGSSEAKAQFEEAAEDAVSAYVLDAQTGQVLYQKNETEELPPASMTKIMTMLLIMEALEDEKIQLNDKVRTSNRAASMGGSQIFLEEGEVMTVDEMLKGIAVGSANDASVAMAEHISGSEGAFIEKMNQKAKSLDLEHTSFKNTTGLPADKHYTSAQDLAAISRELLQYEKILEYTGLYEDYLRKGKDNEFWLVNTNRLVRHYDGVDGLKTGYTKEARYNLTATAEKNGMRIITVLMGADSPKERNQITASLLDDAFQHHEYHQLASKGDTVTSVRVEKGKHAEAEAVLEKDAGVVLRKGEDAGNITEEIKTKKIVTAPASSGEQVGTIRYYNENDLLSEADLVLKEDIVPAGWTELFGRSMQRMMGNAS